MLVMKEYLNRVSFFNEPIASNMKVNLYLEEKGKQKAYATVVVDEKLNINRIRVMSEYIRKTEDEKIKVAERCHLFLLRNFHC